MIYVYRFVFNVTQPLVTETFLGSRWRSVLIKALYQTVCFNKKIKHCQACIAFKSCGYPYFFDNPSDQSTFHNRPHPYIIQTDSWQPESYSIGDTIAFDLTLLGKATAYLPFLIHGLATVRLGRTQNQQTNLQLQSVTQKTQTGQWQSIYEQGVLQDQYAPINDAFDIVSKHHSTWSLNFYTPLRLVHQNRLVRQFDSTLWKQALQRKLWLYHQFYQLAIDDQINWDDLRVDQHQLQWVEWQRYSNRQKKSIPMGGLMGDLTITTTNKSVKKALIMLQHIGVGKGNSMGLGQYQIAGQYD